MSDEREVPLTTEAEQSEKRQNEGEIQRLAGRTPLKTILILSVGPVMSQIVGALFGMLGSLWCSHVIGEEALGAIGLEICFEGMGRAFGYFLMIAASTQISALFGRGLQEDATQVVCDLLRVSVICGAIVPAILLPCHNYALEWFGARPETIQLGWDYICPLIGGTFFACMNLTLEGVLQAEGRALLLGILNAVFLVFAMGICAPILLLVFKIGISGIGWSVMLADAVQGVLLFVLYFRGKFGVKPKWNQFFKKFSGHTRQALSVGASQLISLLANALPGIPVRKLIRDSCATAEMYDIAMAGFNVLCRYALVINCVLIALTTGFIPPGSYAYAAKLWKRWLLLAWHAVWMAAVWSIVTGLGSWIFPRQISAIFGDGQEFLDMSEGMLKYSNGLGVIAFVRFNTQAMLQTMQSATRAMIVSFTSNFGATLVFAYVLYYTNKHDPIRLMWMYPLSTAVGFVLGIALLIGPLIKTIRTAKGLESTFTQDANTETLASAASTEFEDLSQDEEKSEARNVQEL